MDDTQKERLRRYRRKAYQEAKAKREEDPRYQELLALQKERRKQAYQEAKAKRKAAVAEEKRKNRDERDKALYEMLKRASETQECEA